MGPEASGLTDVTTGSALGARLADGADSAAQRTAGGVEVRSPELAASPEGGGGAHVPPHSPPRVPRPLKALKAGGSVELHAAAVPGGGGQPAAVKTKVAAGAGGHGAGQGRHSPRKLPVRVPVHAGPLP